MPEYIEKAEKLTLPVIPLREAVAFPGIPISFDSVDNAITEPVSFIKMDIEGAEKKALDGAKETIKKYKPKLYVCAYHRNEDFFALPEKILSLNPDYNIFLRHHPYIPAWETNFYCV